MLKKIDMIEFIAIVICLIFAIAITLYHVSYSGYLGLSEKAWSLVWALSENGLSLTMCVIIGVYFSGTIGKLFRWLFIPYFSLKLIYHISCYSGIYLLSKGMWSNLWSAVLVLIFIVGLFMVFIKIRHA
jgi:hypothetical protein